MDARRFRERPAPGALVPPVGMAVGSGSPTGATTVAGSRSRLANRLNGARLDPPRTELSTHGSPTELASCKLDDNLDHKRTLHTEPGTPDLDGCGPDPSADDPL